MQRRPAPRQPGPRRNPSGHFIILERTSSVRFLVSMMLNESTGGGTGDRMPDELVPNKHRRQRLPTCCGVAAPPSL
jgi:hypothetical protein